MKYHRALDQLGKPALPIGVHSPGYVADSDEQAREELTRPLKESTVRTVLRRLEDKGYVNHTVVGRTFHFIPAEARSAVAAKAVQRIVDWFCNGSLEEVLVGMVDNAALSPKQLQMISENVAKAKLRKK